MGGDDDGGGVWVVRWMDGRQWNYNTNKYGNCIKKPSEYLTGDEPKKKAAPNTEEE